MALCGINGSTRVGTELISAVARAASRHACSMLMNGEPGIRATTPGGSRRTESRGFQNKSCFVYQGRIAPRPPTQQGPPHDLKPRYLVGFTMGFRIMRLVTLWLVASAEGFRVHGASATPGAKGVQGSTARGHQSTKEVNKKAAGSHGVCSVGDSPTTCQELTAKYRGGGEFIFTQTCPCIAHFVVLFGLTLSHSASSFSKSR